MKKKLLILTLLVSAFSMATAQQTKVHYQEIMTLDMQLPEDMPEEIRNQIPDQRIHSFDLNYDGDVALYANSESGESGDIDISTGDEDNEFQFKMSAPKFSVYTNREKDEHIGSRNFMGKQFLIVDRCNSAAWKITSDQKAVMGIPCIKATTKDEIVAWFAPSIKAPHGPNGYGGLPGLILAMEFPENNREIIATSIKETTGAELIPPKKGKKVNQEKFDEIVEEKMKEMGAEGGGGIRIITIEEEN